MSHTERIVKLRQMLDSGHSIDKQEVMRRLGISAATFKRDLAYLQDRLNTPVKFDRQSGGYRLERTAQLPGTQYELPGLWLSAEEIHALLTMQHLLADLDTGGLLGPQIEPLMKRLGQLLGSGSEASTRAELRRRIRVQTVGARKVHLPHFQALGTALLRRKRLLIDYHSRGSNTRLEREVSPQRLIHYRDNWYLDAWCHVRKALRSFSVDAIGSVQALDKVAIDVAEDELDEVLGSGYGIFAGREVQLAVLRFSADRSRWVAAETWHPKQRGHFDEVGRWVLELPYADPRELVMDILRHVPEVEVVGPVGLRDSVQKKLRAALSGITR